MSSHAVQTHVKLILYRRKAQASVAFIAGGENIENVEWKRYTM
jgi:hypothetical protein